ncbi:MAG: hypothetical protein IJK52_12495 [Oscillospiraceae bacterium]|nr:hypothetical protein [Oscillospiraceae bacterium]
MSTKQNAKKAETENRIVTESGFFFTPPEHILDDWDFIELVGRMVSPTLTETETVSVYFDVVKALLAPDDLERLKAHVKKGKGYCSFNAMRTEIEEIISKLKKAEGNSSSLPE